MIIRLELLLFLLTTKQSLFAIIYTCYVWTIVITLSPALCTLPGNIMHGRWWCPNYFFFSTNVNLLINLIKKYLKLLPENSNFFCQCDPPSKHTMHVLLFNKSDWVVVLLIVFICLIYGNCMHCATSRLSAN